MQRARVGRARLHFVLMVAVFAASIACAGVEKGFYGVTSVDVEGVEEMDERALKACLVTLERPSFNVKLGIVTNNCGEPPFDKSAPRLTLWRWPWTDWPTFNHAIFDQDLERVLRWYRARGFYDAKVVDVKIDPPEAERPGTKGECDPETEKCTVSVTILVDEGLPTRTRRITLKGIDELDSSLQRELKAALSLSRSERFDEWLYEAGKREIVEVLSRASYAGAKAEGEVRIQTGERLADVEYTVTPGPSYRFGKLTITGHGELPVQPIEAAADLPTGEIYEPAVLKEAQAEVFALGAFSGVELIEHLDEKTQRANIEIHVSRLAPTELRLGVGVLSGANRRTDTGELTSIPQWDAHLFASFERRHVFGTLGKLRIDERPRLIFNRDFPRFTKPAFGNVIGFGINQPGLVERRTDSFFRTEWDYGPDPFLGFRRSDIFFRIGARRGFFTRRLVNTLAVQQDLFIVPTSRGNQTSDGSQLPTSYGYSFLEEDARLDLRNHPTRPRKGAYFGVNGTAAPRWSQSDWTAFKVSQDTRLYAPLPLDMVLAARFAIASLFILDASSELDAISQRLGPSAYRLRGGGAYGNRGFLAGQLGAGIQGGVRRWESSLELRVPFGSDFGLVGFFDVGDVNDAKYYRFSHLNASAGAGLRYYTIIGALRLDAGFRIPGWQRTDGSDGVEDDANEFPFSKVPGALHLTIGESF